MFEPKYTISIRLLENVKKIAVLVAELNRQRPQKVALAELEKSAREISAHTSTSIEGNPLPLTEVKKILQQAPAHARDSETEVLNYNNVLLELNQKLESGTIHFNLDLILHIHKGVMQKLMSDYRCGHLRKEPVFVNNPKTGKTVYLPPDHQGVKVLMEDMIQFIEAHRAETDPLILAGLFHKQFVLIHPFMDGNGRTTRLATKVLLASMGLNLFNLFSFENYYNKNVAKYFESVGALGNYYDIKDHIDFTPWLEYFTDGIIDELLRVQKLLSASGKSPETELKPHHVKMIQYIESYGYINDSLYAKLIRRAKATRALDFNQMIDRGLIERLGKGKNTYYKLKNAPSSSEIRTVPNANL